MDGRMDGWQDGLMDGRRHGWTEGCMAGLIDRYEEAKSLFSKFC